jgi:Phage integrase family
VEVLRHAGIRIEELLELTHLSIRQYQRPNGEVIALLVIAPSKTDRERVIPMSAELFAVIAAIIRRRTQHGGTIPLIQRYDNHERRMSDPMPFLFQRHTGAVRRVISPATVLVMLRRRCAELAKQHPGFCTASFTPHDFRRLLATDLVNNGLPIHIGAALLGHLNLQTTRGYVAVFNEDVVRHYQEFLDRRRKARSADEYKPVTDTEWSEFEELRPAKSRAGRLRTAIRFCLPASESPVPTRRRAHRTYCGSIRRPFNPAGRCWFATATMHSSRVATRWCGWPATERAPRSRSLAPVSCLDPTTGRALQIWGDAQPPVASSSGIAFAFAYLRPQVVPLRLGPECPG